VWYFVLISRGWDFLKLAVKYDNNLYEAAYKYPVQGSLPWLMLCKLTISVELP